jgi:LysM repeat protein
MSFYAAQSYPGLVAENPTLVIAFSNLLTSFGKTTDPETLANFLNDYTDPLSLQSITKYDSEVIAAGGNRGWPTSKHSIVGFNSRDEEGNAILLYCLVFDTENRKVIDSRDGTVTGLGVLGEPAFHATYVFNPKTPEPEEDEAVPATPEKTYVVLQGERLFDIARKLGISEQDIIDHNDLDDPYNLRRGTLLHLPVAIENVVAPVTTYDIFDQPKLMHVSREGGAMKWHFGKHETIKDIISGSGMYDYGSEVWVYGLASVPVEGEMWAYHMDAVAVGEGKVTGKPRYSIGFAFADLSEGALPAPTIAEEPTVEAVEAIIAAIEEAEPSKVIWEQEQSEVLYTPNKWRSTFVSWTTPESMIVDLPDGQEEILIHDLEEKRGSKRIKQNGSYVIAGTFWKDGVEYGRPLQCLQIPTKPWYGIPMEVLKREAEVYSVELELADRLALKKSDLSPIEKYAIPALAMTNLSYERLKLYGKKFVNKHKEKIK